MVELATGASITSNDLINDNLYDIRDYGALAGGSPISNTMAVNRAIDEAAEKGGTVLISGGTYKTYTIHLKSNVNICIEKGACIQAAKTDITKGYELQAGEGGNYDEPEINPFAMLQDHAHSYFANSLIYGKNISDVMIYGGGLIDGADALLAGDPFNQPYRNRPGHDGEWFGNKAVSIIDGKNIVISGISIRRGGHFALITGNVENLLVEDVLIDSLRDGYDVDCCRNVTIKSSRFNAINDDALVIKSTFAAGKIIKSENILIENCTVSGYDVGGLYDGTCTCNQQVAKDMCGPTGRIKLGTEGTGGFDRITVRNVTFRRSRGFALEAVDGGDLTNVCLDGCIMENVSSSPIFLYVGDRGRYPVTGNTQEECFDCTDGTRFDNKAWVLPDREEYGYYPVVREVPACRRETKVCFDGVNDVMVAGDDAATYYNKSGCNIAVMKNILIRNVKATDCDPRYPVIISGLMDSKITDVTLENIEITYRGKTTREDCILQRQGYTNWDYGRVQTIPWYINPFFAKNEMLIPRYEWSEEKNRFVESEYNVPENPGAYPEPSIFGILPAYGMYVRHARNVVIKKMSVSSKSDERAPYVFDDVENIMMTDTAPARAVCVKNNYKRRTNYEYVKDEPYQTTQVTGMTGNISVESVVVNAPQPGTPRDKMYPFPTINKIVYNYYKIPENGAYSDNILYGASDKDADRTIYNESVSPEYPVINTCN